MLRAKRQLVEKEQANTLTEQNKKPRNRPTVHFWQKYKGNSMKKVLSFQQMFLEQLSIHVQKSQKKKKELYNYTPIKNICNFH